MWMTLYYTHVCAGYKKKKYSISVAHKKFHAKNKDNNTHEWVHAISLMHRVINRYFCIS